MMKFMKNISFNVFGFSFNQVADGQVKELQELHKDPYYYLTVRTKSERMNAYGNDLASLERLKVLW